MRKILVVLLILSVMGGVFAQENNWGKISGEATLKTTLDFAVNDINEATMAGDFDGVKFVVQWDKVWDNAELGKWSITLPIRASNGYFGTNFDDEGRGKPGNVKETFANVTYTLGDLTVKVPFWFRVNNQGDYPVNTGNNQLTGASSIPGADGNVTLMGIPVMQGNADVNANWASTNWGFKFGVANLYVAPVVSHAGGYFHFMNGRSQLYVSRDNYNYKGDNTTDDFNVYETNWWRASDYVLNPNMARRNAPGFYDAGDEVFTHNAMNQYSFHWENINENGIAYRFFLMEDILSLGIAFASSGAGNTNSQVRSNDNAPPFELVTDNLLIEDFLKHPVFGVKYDNKQLGVSAMVGLEPWDDNDEDSDIYIHAGAYFQLFDNLKINGDISARFATGPLGKDEEPNFNVGVEVTYTNALPLFAGFGFKLLDLVNKQGLLFGSDFIVGFGGAVRDGYTYKSFGDSNAGPMIALKGHVNGWVPKDTDNIFDIGLGLMAGWKNFVLVGAPS
ncbi:MAG: hypothetical protein LBG94_07905, partial [Treponema sp.]|nr:hypothetical protein [Treponema sp.]